LNVDVCEVSGTQDAPIAENVVVKNRSLCWLLPQFVFIELPIKKSSSSRSPATEAQLGAEYAIDLGVSAGWQVVVLGL
jgi:hypothetical protein